jgi:hypothetical protein
MMLKKVVSKEDTGDFLSKEIIVAKQIITLYRLPKRVLATGAVSSKIDEHLTIAQFNSVITSQLESWGHGIPFAESVIS